MRAYFSITSESAYESNSVLQASALQDNFEMEHIIWSVKYELILLKSLVLFQEYHFLLLIELRCIAEFFLFSVPTKLIAYF